MTSRAAPAWTPIMLTWWATTSCSSRAIRTRSSNTARRAFSSRSRSAARALLRRLGLRRALAQREAGEPGDREQDRDEDELAGGVVGVVVDDDRRAAPSTTASPIRPWTRVGEAAEQQRRGHAGGVHADA